MRAFFMLVPSYRINYGYNVHPVSTYVNTKQFFFYIFLYNNSITF